MPFARFSECAVEKGNEFVEGIHCEIVIDSKNTLHYNFLAMQEGEAPRDVLARAPHEIQTNWSEELLAYLNGHEAIKGTPISSVSAISRAQCENLKACGIYSVEDLASCPQPRIDHMGATGAKLKEIAQQYLADRANGPSDEVLAMRAENAELRAMLEELLEGKKGEQPPLPENPDADKPTTPRRGGRSNRAA